MAGIGGSDGSFYENKYDFLQKKYSNVEDRQDESPLTAGINYVSDQLTMEKAKAIWQHPLAPVSQTMTANMPVTETPLGKDLGLNDIKMPSGSPTEPAGALKPSGGSQVPGNGGNQIDVDRMLSVQRGGPPVPMPKTIAHIKTLEGIPGVSPDVTDEDVDRAIHVALSTGPGTMAGVSSKTFDLNAKAMAQIMESKGEDIDKIFQKTGMFRGVEGKWRYEIPDQPATIKPETLKYKSPEAIDEDIFKQIPFDPSAGMRTANLPDFLNHPELYKAYPQLKNVKVAENPDIPAGSANWSHPTNTINIHPESINDKGIVMHEVQHAIQDIEGFPKGGAVAPVKEEGQPIYKLRHQLNPDVLNSIRDAINDVIQKHASGRKLTEEEIDGLGWYGQILGTHSRYLKAANEEAAKNYMNLAGETEARNVQLRHHGNQEMMSQTHPRFTEDVPPEQQIIVDEPSWTTAYGVFDPYTRTIIPPKR